MCLIPVGVHQGKVLALDDTNQKVIVNGVVTKWLQRWTILDPETQVSIHNDVLDIPGDNGDLFCCGHTWLPNGKLLVAGGTRTISTSPYHVEGTRLAYLYEPEVGPFGNWKPLPPMVVPRWYPTVTLLGDPEDRVIVAGGTNLADTTFPRGYDYDNDTAVNSYEVYRWNFGGVDGSWELEPTTGWFKGPRYQPTGAGRIFDDPFEWFPRMHSLSERAYGSSSTNGWCTMSGTYRQSAGLDHKAAAGQWPLDRYPARPSNTSFTPALLLPGFVDTVIYMGGYGPNGPQTLVQVIDYKKPPGSPKLHWTTLAPLNRPRSFGNAVILADGTILKLGGRSNPSYGWPPPPEPELAELQPELYWQGFWHLMPAEASPRTYHSTGLLLPSGRLISASGDTRTWDYQVFSPHYLQSGVRPQITNALPTSLGYNATLYIEHQDLPVGVSIAKVALIAPGSVTHHTDQHTRWVELAPDPNVQPPEGVSAVAVTTPLNKTYAPRGYYMVVLITNLGIPSEARWIRLFP